MMNENGRCDTCLKRYDFGTDGHGHHVAMHPISPCKPPKQGYIVTYIKCLVCTTVFPVAADKCGRRTVFCSAFCRNAHFVKVTKARRARDKQKALTDCTQQDSLSHSA